MFRVFNRYLRSVCINLLPTHQDCYTVCCQSARKIKKIKTKGKKYTRSTMNRPMKYIIDAVSGLSWPFIFA